MRQRGRQPLAAAAQEAAARVEEHAAAARSLVGALQAAGVRPDLAGQAERLARALAETRLFLAQLVKDLASQGDLGRLRHELCLSVLDAQEEERRKLAREIHDGPAQLLANLGMRLDGCQRLADLDPQRLKEELQQLKELVQLSLQDVRKILFDLRPMALDDLGLVPALRAYVKGYQARTAIAVDLASFGADRRFAPAFEVAVYRLVQECLTNVEKHAAATRVWITLECRGQELKVTVKDNGVGFDPARVQETPHRGFGLRGMRERAELVSGRMEIQSSPGQGTRVQFTFPLPEAGGA